MSRRRRQDDWLHLESGLYVPPLLSHRERGPLENSGMAERNMARRCCCPVIRYCRPCLDGMAPDYMYVRFQGVGDEPYNQPAPLIYPHNGNNVYWNDVWWELKRMDRGRTDYAECVYGATTAEPCQGAMSVFEPNHLQPFPVGCDTIYPWSDPYSNMYMRFSIGPFSIGTLTIGACGYLDNYFNLHPTWTAPLSPVWPMDCMDINVHWIDPPVTNHLQWLCASWRSWEADIEIRSPPNPAL